MPIYAQYAGERILRQGTGSSMRCIRIVGLYAITIVPDIWRLSTPNFLSDRAEDSEQGGGKMSCGGVAQSGLRSPECLGR